MGLRTHWEGINMREQIVIAPKHLGSLTEICQAFGKSRKTVQNWIVRGAPIALDGRQYCAEYNALMNWLVEQPHLNQAAKP